MSAKLSVMLVFAAALIALATPDDVTGDDWPQFRGPNRDGVSRETGLSTRWPEAGPPELWRIGLGVGYSGVAAVGSRLYTMDSQGEKEFAVALDAATGRELWRTEVGAFFREIAGDGPRATPTVEDGLVWAIGSFGDVVALRTEDGARVWSVALPERFSTPMPPFGFPNMPLIVGEHLVIEAGAAEGGSIVALDKKSGELAWRTPTHGEFAMSSPIHVTWQNTEQLLFLNHRDVVSVGTDGEILWTVPFAPRNPVKAVLPLFVPPDLIFVSASYDIGGMMVRLKPGEKGDGTAGAEVVWNNRRMRNHFNTSIAHDGLIYGFDNATLKCIEAESGSERWAKRAGFGKGSMIYADGHLLVLSAHGRLLLVEATGEAYREKSAVQLCESRTWTPPSLADGRLYVRSTDEIVALDLRRPAGKTTQGTAKEAAPADLAASSAIPGPVAGLNVETIVARYIEARGGTEALARIKTVRQTGHFLYHADQYPFTIYHKLPNRYRFEARLPSGELMVEAYDGTTGWQQNSQMWLPGRTDYLLVPRSELPATRLVFLLEDEADFEGPLVAYRAKGHTVELVGSEALDDGVAVYHLRVTLQSGRVQDWYVDQRDFKVVRKTNRHADPMGYGYDLDFERRWFFSEHRRASGVLMPVSWEREDFQNIRTFKVEEIDVNIEFNDVLFVMPQDAEQRGEQ